MDLSTTDNPPRSNQQRQHQYVNDSHKPTPSSRQTALIDLSRPLAPVYHGNVPVISQTRGPVIVTADHAPPPPTRHVNDSCWQLQSQPSNIQPPIYEISSSDDDTVAAEEGRLVIDEYANSSVGEPSNESKIDTSTKEMLIYSARKSIKKFHDSNKEKLVGSRHSASGETHILHSMKLKKFALHSAKNRHSNKDPSDKKKSLLKTILVEKSGLTKLKEANASKNKKSSVEKEKIIEYNVKVSENVSPLKLIFSKSTKGNKNPAAPCATKSKAVSQDDSGSSKSLKSSCAAENMAKPGIVKSHGSKDYKYEKNREQYGKQTTCKSSSNNTKSHKDGKSHDSTKKSTPKENDEVEMKKHQKVHTSAVMSAAKPKTKHGAGGDKSDKKLLAADRKKVVLSDRELCRKFGCKKKAKVVLHRMSKEEIRRFTHRTLHRIPKIGARPHSKMQASSKIDNSLRASALMDLLNPASSSKTQTPRPKIIFAPRRVVKCHNTAATAAPVEKQKRHSDCSKEKKKICVPSKTYPRELIGLLERDIERAVPLERFINDEKRSDKVDWLVLDGKMQFNMHRKELLRHTVKVKFLMPPQYYATDQIEEQKKPEEHSPAKLEVDYKPKMLSTAAKRNQDNLRKFLQKKASPCCTVEEKEQFKEKLELASHASFLDLFSTPKASIEKQQELLPNHWRSKILSDPFLIGKYLLRGVNPLSREYAYVQAKFNKSSRERVLAIDKVENPHLWFRYQVQKERLQLRSPFVQEFHLFHGTNKKYLESILTNNLDWKFFGRKKGSRFGQGVYFSPLSSYALHYTDHAPQHSIMILFRVLSVKQCIGFEDSELPDDGYDTAISENGKVWAKFDADEMYPDYVIHFNYEDPEDKAVLYEKYRAKLEKKKAAKWMKRYKEHLVWNEFRQKHQKRPMTWRRFYQKVKRWKLKPLATKRSVTLKSAEWKGPHGTRTKKTYNKDKLNSAPYKSLSIWKQPKQYKQDAKKPFAPYLAKKRPPWHNKNYNSK